MRMIESGGPSEGAWSTRIVAQLSFIKKHLRYPLDRRTAWPAVAIAGMLPTFCFVSYLTAVSKPTIRHGQTWLISVIITAMMLPAIAAVRRYIQTLRFIAIPARRSVAENMQLLQRFLREHHFAFARHPGAPEVYQIISKSISALRDEREVVVFIADDRRILINSHFTQNRFRSAIGVPHYRQIAKQLAAWLRDNSDNGRAGVKLPAF